MGKHRGPRKRDQIPLDDLTETPVNGIGRILPAHLADRYVRTRERSVALAAPLSAEDCQVQSMPDVSPTKWHLAHTTWFFETFVLREFEASFEPFDADFHFLFNSYYEAEGDRHARPHRGLISRPSLDEVLSYRRAVDARLTTLLRNDLVDNSLDRLTALVELGCQHEEQHQELILTDIQHVLSCNPLLPAYCDTPAREPPNAVCQMKWLPIEGGLYEIGADKRSFHFDHEGPRHQCLVHDFQIASQLVTNAEYLAFIQDGGYERAHLWLSEGWARIQDDGWQAPFYWRRHKERWLNFTLHGLQELNMAAPVSHLSYYEADAYARWAGARLPTEQEWEVACSLLPDNRSHPPDKTALVPSSADGSPDQMLQIASDCWQWTASAFAAYPGFDPLDGAIGEYNGKFMCGQFVLRGGSCLTPPGHARPSYRNFFPPDARWQMTGLRLAKNV